MKRQLLLLGTVSIFVASALSSGVAGAEPGDHAGVGETVSAPGGGGGRQPLGVQAGYEALVPRSLLGGYYPHGYSYETRRYGAGALDAAHEIVGVAPRYFQGDQWKPASKSPEAIAAEQRKLLAAGFLSPSDSIRLGFWGESTRKAYAQALSAANASGLDYDATLIAAANAVPLSPDQSYQAGC